MRKGNIVTEAEMRRFLTHSRNEILVNETWEERAMNDRKALIQHLAVYYYNLGCYDTENRIAEERKQDGIERDLAE